MDDQDSIFICPVCFQVCETEQQCHEHRMLKCTPGPAGDERRKPLHDRFGQMVSRAPRWYLEASGAIPAWTPRDE